MKHGLSSIILLSCIAAAGAAQAGAANIDAITTGQVHVRSGPSPRARALAVLPREFPLTVGNCTRTWCQIYYSNRNGWAFMPALAFREGTGFYNDPNLGPFANGANYKRGRLYQTAYLTPPVTAAGGNIAGGGAVSNGAAGENPGGKIFGRLKSLAFRAGKAGVMNMTPVGGALTAASMAKKGMSAAQTARTANAAASAAGHIGAIGQAGQIKQAKQASRINPLGQISRTGDAAKSGLNRLKTAENTAGQTINAAASHTGQMNLLKQPGNAAALQGAGAAANAAAAASAVKSAGVSIGSGALTAAQSVKGELDKAAQTAGAAVSAAGNAAASAVSQISAAAKTEPNKQAEPVNPLKQAAVTAAQQGEAAVSGAARADNAGNVNNVNNTDTAGRANGGWWTNYQRPTYQGSVRLR